jgi:hypothetical protein
MTHLPSYSARSLALAVLGACVVLAPATWAEETTLERIQHEMKVIRDYTSNAGSKLKNRVMGSVGHDDPTKLTSPARLCCSNNLNKIDESQLALQALLFELSECYEQNGQPLGTAAVEFTKSDLLLFGKSVVEFAVAPTVPEAMGQLGLMTRTYLQLAETIDSLEPCPADGSEDTPAKDKDKKKKNKKKKSEETDK